MKPHFLAPFGVALLLLSSAAHAADGIVLQRAALPLKVQQDFSAQIAKARASDPQSFVAVREAVARASAADEKARGHRAPIGRYLAGLGSPSLLPMIELAVFDAPSIEVTPKLRRDLIEGIGLLKDARSLPVLETILVREADAETVRTTAEAIARLDSDAAKASLLGALAGAEGPRRVALLSGMSHCRRAAIANAIAAEKLDPSNAKALATALGNVGNAWAWKTLTNRAEESAVRSTSARALVAIFTTYDGEARTAASNALMVVDAPESAALVAAAKSGASVDTRAALDALEARLSKNPTR